MNPSHPSKSVGKHKKNLEGDFEMQLLLIWTPITASELVFQDVWARAEGRNQVKLAEYKSRGKLS